MKNIKLIALIIIVFIIFTASACSKNNSDNTNGANEQSQANNQVSSTEATTVERPDIPAGTNYNGYNFKILARHFGTDPVSEVYTEQETGDTMNDALYKRNNAVEGLLNIKISQVTTTDTDLVTYVKKIVQAGDSSAFDAMCIQDWDNIGLLQAGSLVNLYTVPNMNLKKQWWDQKAVADLSYKGDKLYAVNGDICWYDKYSLMVVYFNKNLFDKNGLQYPYQDVLDGKWTLAEFSALIKNFTKDVNGDGILDQEDQWGMLENVGAIQHFMIGSGETVASVNSDGVPVINSLSDRQLSVVEALGNLFSDKNNVLIAQSGQMPNVDDQWTDGLFYVFRNGRGLMMAEMVGTIPTFRDMEDDFGLLPQPKFDETQPDYCTFTSGGWASSYSIPITSSDISRTGMILETMAGYSSDTIIPALIDVSLKSKFARDEQSGKMLEIVFATKKYDWCERFQWGGIYDVYANVTTNGFGNFTSSVEKLMPKTQAALDKTINIFESLN
ncbi:MAG: hypothetical protein FWD71_17885 [Oscillospiraceae bacterium]|nr:hypothetical protein [Oscillospiraceae bacterium]